MALPAGRYGVTKNQLLKIKKLPMNTIKLIEELTEKFDLLGTASTKDAISVVTESSDLVESGAVKDIVGWGNKNGFDLSNISTGESYFTSSQKGKVINIANPTAGTYKNTAFLVSVKPNTDMHIVSNVSVSSGVARISVSTADNVTEIASSGAITSETVDLSFNTGNNTVLLIEVYCTTSTSELGNVTYTDMMLLSESETDLTYEPYHASVADSLEEKADNSVIGTVEDGDNASQAYAVGSHFIRNKAFCSVTQAISQGGTLTEGTNYTVGDVADELKTVTETYNFEIDDASVPFTFYRFGKIVIASVSYSMSALTIPTTWTPVNVTVSEAFRKSVTNFIPVICPNGKIVYIRITVYGIVDISSVDGSSIWLQGSGVTTV